METSTTCKLWFEFETSGVEGQTWVREKVMTPKKEREREEKLGLTKTRKRVKGPQ